MPKERKKASQKNMLKAYEAAKSGRMSIREAAKKYDIPKSTLIDKVKGKSPLDCKKGPKPILSKDEEKSLADWGVKMASIGFTRVRTQIMYTVKTILDKEEKEGRPREKRFGESNLPGRDWWGRYLERHSKLKKICEQVEGRAQILAQSDAAVCKWRTGLKKIYQRYSIKDPSCIFTCTITRFVMDGFLGTVRHHPKKKLKGSGRYVTILTAASADGKFVPPMIVYPGDQLEDVFLDESTVEGTFFTKSRKGDLNVELFYSWIGNHFLDYTPSKKTIILLIKGNWPYIDMYVSRLCKDKNIILFCMPPKSAFFQDPLSQCFSKQMPLEWKLESMNFELLNPGMKVDRYVFPAVFSNVWTHLASEKHMRESFEISGIWPPDGQKKRPPAVSSHVDAACFDEEGNVIEVAVYEEVISEHQAAESATPTEEQVTEYEVINDSAGSVLEQFEKAQGISAEEKDVFEARFASDFEDQHDLVYNAWKALKELIVMQEDAAKYATKSESDDEMDDDDSLLDWLADESDDDEDEKEMDVKQENEDADTMTEEADNARTPVSEIVDDDDDQGSDKDANDEMENDHEHDIPSSSSDESLDEETSRSSPEGLSLASTMSPLKVTRYVHPGAAGRRKKGGGQKKKRTK